MGLRLKYKGHVDSLSSKEGSMGSATKHRGFTRGSCTVMYVVGRKVMHGIIFD